MRAPASKRLRPLEKWETRASMRMLAGPVSKAKTSCGLAWAGITVTLAMPPRLRETRPNFSWREKREAAERTSGGPFPPAGLAGGGETGGGGSAGGGMGEGGGGGEFGFGYGRGGVDEDYGS